MQASLRKCLCYDGYKLHVQDDSQSCNDINECVKDNGGCEHTCRNNNGSFSCGCNDGYELLPNAVSCRDINECKTDNGRCEHNCLNFIGTYTCLCSPGSILNADNKSCRDVGPNSVSSSVILYVDGDTGITDQTVYSAIAKMLESYFKTVIGGTLSVFINNLRQGSIIADYTVAFEDGQNVNNTADSIVKSIIDLEADATLFLDGKPVQAKSVLPDSSTDLCHMREMLAGQCEEGWYCKIENNIPYCRISSDQRADYVQIVVPVLGSLAFVIVMLTLCVIYIKNRHRYWTSRVSDTPGEKQNDDLKVFAYVNRADLTSNVRKSVPSNNSSRLGNMHSKMQNNLKWTK